jgi:ATP-dependent 26S proteasome regulatory subunit
MIFSTNLPSIKDIDPALVRPGRCYDILNFAELNQEQAEALATKVGVTLNGKRDKWSIADIFFNDSTGSKFKTKENKMGFV